MKLFKKRNFLKKILLIELILVFSGVSSFVISAYVRKKNSLPQNSSPPAQHRYLMENYSTLNYFLNLPEDTFSLTFDFQNPSEVKDKIINDIVQLKRAEDLVEKKKYRQAETVIHAMGQPHDFLERKIGKLILQTLYFQQEYRSFLKQYDTDSIKDYPNNLQIQLLRLNCLIKTNAREKAVELFKKLFLRNTLAPFRKSLTSRTLTRFLQELSYDDWFEKFKYLARRNYFTEFRRERNYIKAPQLHHLFYAEFYYKQRRFKSVQGHLNSVKSPKLLGHKKKLLLKIQLRRRNYDNLFTTLDELKEDSALYAEVLFDAASLLLVRRELDLSLTLLSKYIALIETEASLDRTSNYWKALWLSAWLHYRENREEKALPYFKKGTQSDSDVYKMANTYWYHRLKKADAAAPLRDYPFSYYYAKTHTPGLTAYREGNHIALKRFVSLINGKQGPLFLQLVNDLKTLLKNGLIDEAFDFVTWAKTEEKLTTSERNTFKIIESILYLKKKNFYHAFVKFRNNFDCYQCLRLPKFLGSIYAPIRYETLIDAYCEQHDLDKLFVFALIREESFFRPDAVSPARANGLMQLLYGTAKQVAGKQGIRIRKWDLYNPHTNIRLGTDHLRTLLDRYDDKLHLVLAAYNAGEHRVDAWLRQFGHVPDDVFIEMIPFTETRSYVKNILRNYYYYRFYYGE